MFTCIDCKTIFRGHHNCLNAFARATAQHNAKRYFQARVFMHMFWIFIQQLFQVLIWYTHVNRAPRAVRVVKILSASTSFNPDDELSAFKFYSVAECQGDLHKLILAIYSRNTSINAHKWFDSICIFRDSWPLVDHSRFKSLSRQFSWHIKFRNPSLNKDRQSLYKM